MNRRCAQITVQILDRQGIFRPWVTEVLLPAGTVSISRNADARLKRRDRVQVRFQGNSTPYSYLMDPKECARVEVGDRVSVMSPLTNRVEYPTIVSFDQRASASKYARALPGVLDAVTFRAPDDFDPSY